MSIFERVGAVGWLKRANEELARLGIRAKAPSGLSPTEERIAGMAAGGLRNREIGRALFITEKTVEVNLSRIYRKLDIRSRAQLSARLTLREKEPAP